MPEVRMVSLICVVLNVILVVLECTALQALCLRQPVAQTEPTM